MCWCLHVLHNAFEKVQDNTWQKYWQKLMLADGNREIPDDDVGRGINSLQCVTNGTIEKKTRQLKMVLIFWRWYRQDKSLRKKKL